MELESYALVLFRLGPLAGTHSEDELAELQAAHLAYLARMEAEGKLVGAGPFSDQPDDDLRGMCFYACGVDEARALAADDPSVRAGRLAVEAMTWSTRRGALTFHPVR